MTASGAVRVLLVDDHPLFSRGLELLLLAEARDRITVVGQVADAAQAAASAVLLRPDLAVVDLAMPAPGGLVAVRELRRRCPQVRVVVLSGSEDPQDALAALAAGAVGFLPKGGEPHALVAPLLAAAQGWALLTPDLLARLVPGRDDAAGRLRRELEPAELQLWRMLARGLSAEEVAHELYVSSRTAKRLIAALLTRLQVDNRVQAAALAGSAGLLDRELPD